MTSDAIFAADESWGRSLLGDKAHSMIFDNTKVEALVPDYVATIPFAQGAREIVAWHDEDPARRAVDERVDALIDQLVARYGAGRDARAGQTREARIRRLQRGVQIETRYARNGDATIAWTAAGDAPTDLLFVPGFISHVEHLLGAAGAGAASSSA